MSLYKEWTDLIENQTDATFESFWTKYAGTEQRIYKDILAKKKKKVEGVFSELCAAYDAEPVIFMGFLDGIQTSLKKAQDLEAVKEDSKIKLEIEWETLYFNMWKAKAEYLYTLEEWNGILTPERQKEIEREYKKSLQAHAVKKPGRNDPCPCGSGKKYKNCHGRVNNDEAP